MKKLLIGMIGIFCVSIVSAKSVPAKKIFTPDQQAAIQMIVHQYLVQHPEVLIEASQALQQKQMEEMKGAMLSAVRPNADKFLRNPNSPVIGNPNGTITLVAFLDYNCPYCRSMAKVMIDLTKKDKDLRVVLKEFPIHGEPAVFASQAALAANFQGKYLPLHEAMMSSQEPMTDALVLSLAKQVGLNMAKLQSDMKDSKIQTEIENNGALAQLLQIPGTPAFIVAKTNLQNNGKGDIEVSPGLTSESALQQMINEVSKS